MKKKYKAVIEPKRRARSTALRLPVEQVNVLLDNLVELRKMARSLIFKFTLIRSLYSAEDLVQDAMANMLTAKSFPEPVKADLMMWAYRILRNCAIRFIERNNHEQVAGYGYSWHRELDEIPDPTASRLEAIAEAAKSLRPERAYILQGYLDNKSGLCLAQELNMPHATVRTHHHSAQKSLRKVLANLIV